MIKFYFNIIYKNFKSKTIYRSNIILNIIRGVILLFVQTSVWQALYLNGHNQVNTLSQVLTYMVISTFILSKFRIRIGDSIGESVYSGQLQVDLLYPISFEVMFFLKNLGQSLFEFTYCSMPLILFASLKFNLLFPKDYIVLLFTFLSGLLGILIYSLFNCILGYTSFWMSTNWYLTWIDSACLIIFGGTTVPLWFYPSWLIEICNFLPFRYITFDVVNIYLGNTNIKQNFIIVLNQISWIIILYIIKKIIWAKGRQKIFINGG